VSFPSLINNIRKINETGIVDFICYLSHETWDEVFTNNDVNSLFKAFSNNYLRIFYPVFPAVVSKINSCVNKRNWFTKKLKTQCQLKRGLYLLTRNGNKTNTVNYCVSLVAYCKLLSKNTAETKKEYYNNLITQSKNKTATTWKIIKSETSNTYIRDNITEMNVNGTMTCNPQRLSDAMNQHFLPVAGNTVNGVSSISSNNTINSSTDYLFQTFVKPFPPIKHKNIKRHEIEKTIKSLKLSNSCSYNEISVKILKLSCSYISSPLTKLCNLTLSTGIFPDYLKYSGIKPFCKSGMKNKMDSYRPISIPPLLSKIFDKLTLHRLIQHFNDYQILANEQFGFRQNYSTDRAIFHL
jgi:hypothetical protein